MKVCASLDALEMARGIRFYSIFFSFPDLVYVRMIAKY